ncbi:MAG: hypothetical protein NWE89_08660 [Candidatus Bathyarchaeota archaeon]|nr:hypothetical protein [Candidatus Bathyarchaeota archaeon]
MQCPECQTEMKRDMKKWLGVVIELDEKNFALYYCPNQVCSRFEQLVCKNNETEEPFTGPFDEESSGMIETAYAY